VLTIEKMLNRLILPLRDFRRVKLLRDLQRTSQQKVMMKNAPRKERMKAVDWVLSFLY
jgi:hypothetical protein